MMTRASLSPAFLERLAAGAVAEGLVDAVYCRLPSPLGTLLLVQGPRGLVRVGFPEEPQDAALGEVAALLGPRVVESAREMAETRELLAAYLEGGDPPAPDMPVDLSLVGGPFRLRVLQELRSVPRGAVVTYGALAARAGRGGAARAAGSACARNPVPLVVPCHRVVPSSGGVGAYAGGAARKRALLALEGAIL